MENNTNKYIAVAYKLYAVDGETKELIEETSTEQPFHFISGFGFAHPEFEKHVVELTTGDDFGFSLSKEQAFGEYMEERVLDLDKQIFCINGHFDHENIYKDAIVPLQNEDGNHFYGKVLDITEDTVKMDLNHPYAGKDLQYEGTIVMSREATKEEIQAMVNRLSGEGCCCGGNCGGHGGCGEDGCGCGGDDHNHDECECGCHCH